MDSSPALGRSSPAAIRSRVDLPQPEGPTTQVNSPGAMSRSTGPRAVRALAPRPNVRVSAWARSVGAVGVVGLAVVVVYVVGPPLVVAGGALVGLFVLVEGVVAC